MNLEFFSQFQNKNRNKPHKDPKMRALFNNQTPRPEKEKFLDNIFCKECKTPVFANTENNENQENSCPKCGRDFTNVLENAKAIQEKLREENIRNIKYAPPEKYI